MLGADSAVLDLGFTKRLFDRHQRIALAVRDRGCIFPGCDRPPAWTEAHHITAWEDGGPTDLANGCLLCSFHHHLVHKGEWAVVMSADGIPEILPPPPEAHRPPRTTTAPSTTPTAARVSHEVAVCGSVGARRW